MFVSAISLSLPIQSIIVRPQPRTYYYQTRHEKYGGKVDTGVAEGHPHPMTRHYALHNPKIELFLNSYMMEDIVLRLRRCPAFLGRGGPHVA